MTRVTTTILIVMVLLNGTVAIMEGSGLSEDIGVELAPGVSDSVNDAIQTAQDGLDADAGLGETLVAMILSGLQLFEALITAVFAAPTMLMNLGFPQWIVVPVAAPIYIIGALDFMFIATGRDAL
jgi:hypothetical protein